MRRPLGQHFLIRSSIVHRILRALELKPSDRLLEIGPGKGALTRPLVGQVNRFLLIEKDVALAAEIRGRLKLGEKVEVFCEDFLQSSWEKIEGVLGENFKVVSNLPYQAATAILIKLLQNARPGTTMVLMFQKEVGERLLAEPRCKDFGSLTVFCRLYASVQRVVDVPPTAFRPPPRVWSQVLKFRLRDTPLLPIERIPDFERLLHDGFAHRRKMLRQNLKSFFTGDSAEAIERRLQDVQGSPQARAEELSVEQWIQLFKQA